MSDKHPFDSAAEDFFREHFDPQRPATELVTALQKLIERVYESGRDDAHHEIVSELEGGIISKRRWPHEAGKP